VKAIGDKLLELVDMFAEKSNGIFNGDFGTRDSLAIRICCPSLMEVPDPGNNYCRKGFT